MILISVLKLKDRMRMKNVKFCGVQCTVDLISVTPKFIYSMSNYLQDLARLAKDDGMADTSELASG